MSQNDFNIANQGFPSFRADLNDALQALASNNAGAAEPSTTYANQWWYDTTTGLLKLRNEANTNWIAPNFGEISNVNITGGTIDGAVIGGVAPAAVTTSSLVVNGNNYPSAGALSNRNLIINGAMDVAQRGTSASPAPQGYLIDRFATYKGGGGNWDVAQSPDAPVGFQNSALITITTPTTPSGTDFTLFQTKFEGHDVSYLSQGTASAKTFTLSFWVKSSLAATFSGSVRDATSTVSYVFEYTINSVGTWEYKTVTIAGSTSGNFPLDNTTGLVLAFSQGQGTTYATATVGSWVAGNFHGSTTETDLISNSGATWQITGVQLEVGDTATPFEHRSYGQELALCQRYFWTDHVYAQGYQSAGSDYTEMVQHPVTMRADPTRNKIGAYDISTNAGSLFMTSPPFGPGVNFTRFYASATAAGEIEFSHGFSMDAEL